MTDGLFTAESMAELLTAFKTQFPMAVWETFYVTVLSTALSLLIGLPLGVLLVAGEKGGVLPLPKPVLSILNVIINLLRSIPFLILMIMVFPLSRALIGTTVGTTATIVPLLVTIALTTILGYSAMSGIIGGGGLGKVAIDYGYYRYKYLVMYAAVILLIILVQIFQSVGTRLALKSDKRLKK